MTLPASATCSWRSARGLDADADHYDPELIFLFAALHDTQRENEYATRTTATARRPG
jgi:hypothetical protein